MELNTERPKNTQLLNEAAGKNPNGLGLFSYSENRGLTVKWLNLTAVLL